MASLEGAYDPTGGQAAAGRGPLEKGEYVIAMAKNVQKMVKSGNGDWFIECEFEVMEGASAGRRVWASYNLKNSSQQGMEIAWRDFNALILACGRLPNSVRNVDELLAVPFRAYITIDKKDADRNRISSYKPLGAGVAPQGGQRQAAPANAAAAGGGQADTAAWRQQARR